MKDEDERCEDDRVVVSCTGPEPLAPSESRRRDHSVAVMSIVAPGLHAGMAAFELNCLLF
jgi:hypothetical protein